MTVNSNSLKNKRIIISNNNELIEILKGNKEEFLKNKMYDLLLGYFDKGIKFKVIDFKDFFDYLSKLERFEKSRIELSEMMKNIEVIEIDRLEFDRDQSNNKSSNYKVNKEIENIKESLYKDINEEEERFLENIEKYMKEKYLFSRDVELLKKIVLFNNKKVFEIHDTETSIKKLVIKIENEADYGFIKSEIGSVEYHKFLDANVERMERLVKNLKSYILGEDKIYINQSGTMQDSINIAAAFFDNNVFRAVSGQNNIEESSLLPENPVFKSYKVNRLGQMGYGYDRAYDSEKKIIEDIHYKIGKGLLKDEGTITIVTKWEPCPSCYSVINQFMKLHDKINVEVKYVKRYGEKEN